MEYTSSHRQHLGEVHMTSWFPYFDWLKFRYERENKTTAMAENLTCVVIYYFDVRGRINRDFQDSSGESLHN